MKFNIGSTSMALFLAVCIIANDKNEVRSLFVQRQPRPPSRGFSGRIQARTTPRERFLSCNRATRMDDDGYFEERLEEKMERDFTLRSVPRYEREKVGEKAELESAKLLLELQGDTTSTTTITNNKNIEESCLQIMTPLAQLGKAKAAETFYTQLVDTSRPDLSPETHMIMLRGLLHAWSNQMRLVARNAPSAVDAASRAREVLHRMMQRESGLLDGNDFETVLQNYLFLQPSNIDKIYEVWQTWQDKALSKIVDPPGAPLSAQIIRSIANHQNKNWKITLEKAALSKTIGDVAISHYALIHQEHHQIVNEGILNIYNAMLEVWSKALPPPAKQNKVSEEKRHLVGQKTKAILDEMEQSCIRPNMQTYANILYAYCKAGWLQQAWAHWMAWKDELLHLDEDRVQNTKIDARCLPMLIQSTAKYAQEHFDEVAKPGWSPLDHTKLATEALYDMWTLHNRGFTDMKPEVTLYTSLVCCWANPHFKSCSIESTKSLVQDLNERHQILGWPTLQPDMAFYNAWIGVVRSQFGNTTISLSEEAGSIVKQMEHQSMDNPLVAPDTRVYNFLIDACLSDRSVLGVERAQQTLAKMIDVSAAVSCSRRISPNGRSFASIVRAYTQFDTSKSEYWLDRMEERFVPSSALFEEVILQCCKESKVKPSDNRQQQAERASRLLNRMIELSKVTENPKLQPDQFLYASVIEAWQGLDGDTSDEIARLQESQNEVLNVTKREDHQINSDDDVFQAMKDFEGSFAGVANTFTFNLILRQIANSSGQMKAKAGQIAEEIFVYMLDAYFNKNRVSLRPDLITFNSVISAKSRNPEAAYAFLDNLKQLHQGGMLLDLEPDRISYNQVIDAYQKSSKAGSAEGAERVYNALEQMYELTSDKRFQPDSITFCTLLGAYARDGNSERAEELLLRWIKENKMDSSKHKAPDSTCYDQVLYALAKEGSARNTQRADMLLKLMEDRTSSAPPTTATYNIVLHGMTNSGDFSAPFRVQKLMDRMKSGKLGNKARPDAVTYTTAVRVLCRLGGRDVVQTIEKLVDEAIQSPGVTVDIAFFQNILASLAYCSQEGTLQLAEDLVEKKMPELGVKPSLFAYNGLLSCFAKRGLGEEAEAILKNLEAEAGSLTPNVHTYSLVLDAYAKSQNSTSLERAEQLMERMQGSKSCQPDAKSYTALIQKYARSNVPLKAKRAQAVLHRMTKEGTVGVRPTVVTYNAILNACEYTTSNDLMEKEEAFTVACLTFDEVRKLPDIKPTHTTYGSFLGSVTTLMPRSDARNEIAELVFKRCCKDGQVSQYVLRKLKASVSSSRYRQMLGGRKDDKLPRAWTTNVRERKNERSSVQRKQSPRNNNNNNNSRSDSFVGRRYS